MHLIDMAMLKAVEVYSGKLDLGGQPYILHPLRLMAKAADDHTRVLCLLHDYLEECGRPAEEAAADLLADGFPTEVVDDLLILTRKPGESYMRYIDRAKKNPRTRQVKRWDIEDNMLLQRLDKVSDVAIKRVLKYHKALKRLLAAEAA